MAALEKDRQCDIITPVWNQLEYTKACIISVFKYTKLPFKLILIDNASDSQTAKYLDQIEKQNPAIISIIRNTENLGFIKAVNQGIKSSQARYICLLNNDTQVTGGWLEEMTRVAESRQDIGIVNPNSNTLGWKLKRGQSLQTVAHELKAYPGAYSELAWANGFCMLIKRNVIKQVGLFDEIYGMGTFEDADFSNRAKQLGYLCVRAEAAYVYHHERRSFRKIRTFDERFEGNRRIFFSKWGKTQRILYVLTRDDALFAEKIRKEALSLARHGNAIWIFLRDGNQQNISRHCNIYICVLPEFLFNLAMLWRVLKRRKKFNKICIDNRKYAKRLNRLRLVHQAEVIYTQ